MKQAYLHHENIESLCRKTKERINKLVTNKEANQAAERKGVADGLNQVVCMETDTGQVMVLH